MSKVLVDRELLEQCVELLDLLPESRTIVGVRAILAQPAEAEGVDVPIVATLLIDEVFHGSNGPEAGDWDIEHNPGVTEKLAQQFPGETFDLVRQVDHLAALSAVTAERDRLADALEQIAAGERIVVRSDGCSEVSEVENDMTIDYPGIAKEALAAMAAKET